MNPDIDPCDPGPLTPHVVRLIRSYETRGKGVIGDPIRLVRQFYTFDGALQAEYDPCADRGRDG